MNVVGQEAKESTPIAQNQYGQLTGRVTDEKGNPLEYASVRVLQNGIVKGGAKTDKDGFYMISNLKQGNYTVRTTYAGFGPKEIKDVCIKSSQNEPCNLNLERKKSDSPEKIIRMGKTRFIDPSNPGTKGFNRNEIRDMGG